jgi:putative nucleotidyltransferase with HDIG domain
MNIKEALDHANIIIMTDYPLYQHCISVATICYYSAELLGLDAEKAFAGGLLHDMGKLAYAEITLAEGPSAVAFMDHPVLGYEALKGIDEECAIMAYTHHSYQHMKYPEKMEITVPPHLEVYCQLIAYVDKVESFMTRSHLLAEDAIETVDKFYNFLPNISNMVSLVVSRHSLMRLI